MLPVASECFSNDGVVWFLQTLGLFVKARKVPLRYGFDPVKWTVALDGPKKKGDHFTRHPISGGNLAGLRKKAGMVTIKS